MTTHEVLVAARNMIDRQGWKSTYGFHADGPQCPISAIGRITGDNPAEYRGARNALAGAIGCANNAPSIGCWNDKQKSARPVLAALDQAIAATAPEPADPFTTERFVAEVV